VQDLLIIGLVLYSEHCKTCCFSGHYRPVLEWCWTSLCVTCCCEDLNAVQDLLIIVRVLYSGHCKTCCFSGHYRPAFGCCWTSLSVTYRRQVVKT